MVRKLDFSHPGGLIIRKVQVVGELEIRARAWLCHCEALWAEKLHAGHTRTQAKVSEGLSLDQQFPHTNKVVCPPTLPRPLPASRPEPPALYQPLPNPHASPDSMHATQKRDP